MGRKPQALRVIFSPTALKELNEIWEWNLDKNGFNQAKAYLAFLRGHFDALRTEYPHGRTVSTRPDLQFVTMRWSQGGHGHIAVYQIDSASGVLTIAHVFHTRQNWEQTLKRERR